MSDKDYTMITGSTVAYKTAEIYADRTLTPERIRKIEDDLRKWAEPYGNISITNNHAANNYVTEYGKGISPQIAVIGTLILMISPLIWFFSQIIFCLKRENEFYVIEMMGALINDIRRIYIIDGIFAAAVSSFIYLILSLAGTGGMYKLMNNVITRFSLDYSARYMFNIPVMPFIIGLLLTAACGFMSAYVPYMLYRKKRGIQVINEEVVNQ
jgi:hypothetical protein